MVPAKDFKRRMVVEIDGSPHMIEHIQVQTPSARGAATLYKIKARNLKTRTRVEKTYRATVRGRLEPSAVEKILRGVRLEDGRSAPALVREFVKVKDSYNCDVLSLAAATAAVEDQDYLRATRAKSRSAKR